MIETFEDIIEELANRSGIYGAHPEGKEESRSPCHCRVCWTARLSNRIRQALEIERKLAA